MGGFTGAQLEADVNAVDVRGSPELYTPRPKKQKSQTLEFGVWSLGSSGIRMGLEGEVFGFQRFRANKTLTPNPYPKVSRVTSPKQKGFG